MRRPLLLLLPILALALNARSVRADRPTFELHGFGELQLRAYSEDYKPDYFYFSQWANVLNLEAEADLAPSGFGPFDLISAFARVEVRYECIYTGCAIQPSWRYFGDRANSVPRNFSGGRTTPFTGLIPAKESGRIQSDNELVDFFVIPPFDALVELGASNIDATFEPIRDARFTIKGIDASIGPGIFPMGPWKPDVNIDPIGSLENVPNLTLGLPLRPAVPSESDGRFRAHGLYVPSLAFLEKKEEFGNHEQNLSEKDLSWNHGQGQDERELKELYVDIEMLEGRLWLRAGKQNIVWGKTELFRTTDQFNPQDLALSSLPGLEESRLAQWSVRGTYSFYDVGPLEDVRLELAANLDDFEPYDLGRCGEPYTIWLVCAKTFGLWAHGWAGIGVGGETRPPDPFESLSWVEVGARLEWRYRRFSFQLSDFYGYEDAPVIDFFHAYERSVDPLTGRPLDARGDPLLPGEPAEDVLLLHPANRQLFDVICSATVGIAAGVSPALADRCLVDLTNAEGANLGLNIDPPGAFSQVLGGSGGLGLTGEGIIFIITNLAGRPVNVDLVELNQDPGDGVGTAIPGLPSTAATAAGAYLTDQQEALLGCGPFWGTDCDRQGVDLFNAEASVLLQAFPQFEPGGAVATRPVDGLPVILPGARGPSDDINRNGIPDLIDPKIPAPFRYDPLVDGCVVPGPGACAGATALIDPRTGESFQNEMAALSYNFMELLAALGSASTDENGEVRDPECDVTDPITCEFVRGIFDIAGAGRPEVRAGGNQAFGRRDFLWSGGAEIQVDYFKRNVFGFALDFAEDRSKTNWSVETTWIADQPYSVVDRKRGWDRNDTFNLTVSVDRPTFVNFLNSGRTFFVNSQWFFRYIHDYRQGGYIVHGPFSALGTLTILTGYHQDRLLPALTWVHDIRSTSGGVIGQVTYRFTTELSATVGMAAFYGKPEPIPIALRQPLPTNNAPPYNAHNRYDGLIPLAERDEVFMLLRWTF